MDTRFAGSFTLGLLLLLQGLTVFTGTTTAATSAGGPAAINGFLGGNFLGDLVCQFIECGYGKCRATSDVAGYECVCEPGWKTHKAAPFTSAACILPNCSVDLKCDKPALSLALAPTSVLSSDVKNATLDPDCNSTNPSPQPSPSDYGACKMVWCGEGKCVENRNGSGYHCQCNHGASNLFNNTSWACYKPCSLGSNCYSLSTCPHNLQPPPSPLAPPPSGASTQSAFTSSILRLMSAVLLALVMHA